MNVQYVINHIRYLFFMLFLSPPHCLEQQWWKTNRSALGIMNLRIALSLSFPFILRPAAHPSRSFWGPMAAVPIIHHKTQHPHQALANLYSAAKSQREEERGRGLVMGQILSLCLFGPLTKNKARGPHQEGERERKISPQRRERTTERRSHRLINPAVIIRATGTDADI